MTPRVGRPFALRVRGRGACPAILRTLGAEDQQEARRPAMPCDIETFPT